MNRTGFATVVVSVVLSAGVSALVARFVSSPAPQGAAPYEAAVERAAPDEARPRLGAASEGTTDVERRLAAIESSVARLDETVSQTAAPAAAPSPEAILESLAGARGEQGVLQTDSLAALVRHGDAGIAATAAFLKSGRDESYGGGFSTGNGFFKSYPRLRTVLLDSLRQVSTPAAKAALLDAVRSSGSLLDARDLFLMYGHTSDAEMAAVLSAMVPDLLARMKELGTQRVESEASMLPSLVFSFIERRRLVEAAPALAALVESAPEPDYLLFTALVRISPEHAVGVVERQVAARGPSAAPGPLLEGRVPLAQLAKFYELLFARVTLDRTSRRHIYVGLPSQPFRGIEDAATRAADARVFLAFLEALPAAEMEESVRSLLVRNREALATAIATLEKTP